MTNKDISRGLSQFTGFYKGTYYENGRPQNSSKKERVSVEASVPDELSLYQIFINLGIDTNDSRPKRKK